MRVIDLSMPIHEGMTTYPAHWHPIVEVSQLGRHGIEGRETRKITLGTHTGTHADAPRHFYDGGQTIDQIQMDDLIGEAVLVDLRHMVTQSGLEAIVAKDFGAVSDAFMGRAVVLWFDWDRFLGNKYYYEGHPYLAPSAIEFLVNSGCRMLAMDTPSPDKPHDNAMPAHKALLGSNIVLVEYLVNLRELRDQIFNLFVAPLKIKDADGAPARVFAIESD